MTSVNGWALNRSSCGLISEHFTDLTPEECKRTTTRDMTILAADSRSSSLSRSASKEVKKKIIIIILVVTKGYRVWATTIEGQNIFAPTLCFA